MGHALRALAHRITRAWRRGLRWCQQRTPERVWVWWVTTRWIFSRAYSSSAFAVRKVAQDTDLSAKLRADPRSAKHIIGAYAGAYPLDGDNLVRMHEAREWTTLSLEARGRRVSSLVERNALVELAYIAYRSRG